MYNTLNYIKYTKVECRLTYLLGGRVVHPRLVSYWRLGWSAKFYLASNFCLCFFSILMAIAWWERRWGLKLSHGLLFVTFFFFYCKDIYMLCRYLLTKSNTQLNNNYIFNTISDYKRTPYINITYFAII